MRPRIGITSEVGGDHGRIDGTHWGPYADAVRRAGGVPVHLDRSTIGREREVLDGLQGLLFSGGRDVDLRMYPNPPEFPDEDPEAVMRRFRMRPERERDAYELPLLAEALERDLPFFGICRGCQVLNVALGGRLILDIPTETGTPLVHSSMPPPSGDSSRHRLEVSDGTVLSAILGPGNGHVCNSRHHQAVRVDSSFTAVVSAVSPEDGLVEAIELPGANWVVGVQWHPEHPKDPDIQERFAPLFRAFVEACS
jgi:gamma-glutamyl-gamma-aminobutyrate hydrolase PuuD